MNVNQTAYMRHNAGFFSCCSVRLYEIWRFREEHGRYPRWVDSADSFHLYKAEGMNDAAPHFFEQRSYELASLPMPKSDWLSLHLHPHTHIPWEAYQPVIRHYFTPIRRLRDLVIRLCKRYRIHPGECTGVFYRGTDKAGETKLASYEDFLNQLRLHPSKQLFIQTDDAGFLDAARSAFPSAINLAGIPLSYTNLGVHNERTPSQNAKDISLVFAAILILARCRQVLCGSSNGTQWITHFRGHSRGIVQHLNGEWVTQ